MGSTPSLLRLDTATLLRRFWYLERALILTYGGWVASVARLEGKAALARAAWESSLVADELRTRVFELRYPERSLDPGPDQALINLYEMSLNAPGPQSLLRCLSEVFLPALRRGYEDYLEASDEVTDGPTLRFLRLAVEEKRNHEESFRRAALDEDGGDHGSWQAALGKRLDDLGGISLAPPATAPSGFADPGTPHRIPDKPARDGRFLSCSFYWPDNFDAQYPYGEGARLQLRTAISHLNEVWAVDTAGAILQGLGPQLEWEFVVDASRWLFDESRHMTMGQLRLEEWGFEPAELPLGSYIYEATRGRDALHRLAMLAFFETKNIGKKAERAEVFGDLGDRIGQRHMQFDWADEAIHAGYGRRWLRAASETRERPSDDWNKLLAECETLVSERVRDATEEEKRSLLRQAEYLVKKAERVLSKVEETR